MAEEVEEFVCPACNAAVQPDWAACPSCGVTFDPPAPEAEAGTNFDDLEAEILGAAKESAPAVEPDPIVELEREISQAVVEQPKAQTPPEGTPARPAKAKAGFLGRLGGLRGTAGLAMLLVGAVGVAVMANYDTWVRGQAAGAVGTLQQMSILGAAALSAVGVVLLVLGSGKLKRKPARAA